MKKHILLFVILLASAASSSGRTPHHTDTDWRFAKEIVSPPGANLYETIFIDSPLIFALTDSDTNVVKVVDIKGEIPGGDKAFLAYLERNCNAQVPKNNHAPSGNYPVIAQFIIEKDSTISDVKALTQHGYGLEEEVVRAMRKWSSWSSWKPAIQNAPPGMKTYLKITVNFFLESDVELSTKVISAGEKNSITISVSGTNNKDLKITLSDSAKLKYAGGKNYTIYADKPGKIMMTVFKGKKKKKEQVDILTIEVK